MTFRIESLVEDILLRILAESSVPTTLSMSQTCKYFHTLAFSKSVWVALLIDIDSRVHFELPEGENLDSYSTQELIALAKRAIHGPRSWSPLSSSYKAPVVSRRIELRISDERDIVFWPYANFLLPGGQYMLIAGPQLQCWRVSTSERIWTHEPLGDLDWHEVKNFDAQMVDNGQAAVIVISLRTPYGDNAGRRNTVEIVHLDLCSSTSRHLFSLNTQDTRADNAIEFTRLCGDIAIAVLNFRKGIVIMNWRTQSHMHLPILADRYGLKIIQGYLLLLNGVWGSGFLNLGVWDIRHFASHWSTDPRWSIRDSSEVLKVPPLWSRTIDIPHGASLHQAQLSAHTHPFHKDLYTAWVNVTLQSSPEVNPPPYSSIIEHYAINLDPSLPSVSVHVLSSVRSHTGSLFELGAGGISFTGHILRSMPGTGLNRIENRIVALAEYQHLWDVRSKEKSVPMFENNTPARGHGYQISAHNGALTSFNKSGTKTTVVIQYYE